MLALIEPASPSALSRSDLHIDADGWCTQAEQHHSPNFGARPDATVIDLLVIHNISLPRGDYRVDYITPFFLNQLDCDAHPDFASLRGLHVSSHFVIRRDGRLQQFVSCLDRAWHAGVSEWQGRQGCNDFSIGVELEGCDDQPFEPTQYACLQALTQALQQRFPLRHIVGHQDIAPGRKTDPGPCFDWLAYQAGLGHWRHIALGDEVSRHQAS